MVVGKSNKMQGYINFRMRVILQVNIYIFHLYSFNRVNLFTGFKGYVK
jgi:hypothetical protein